jgi:hypothetical protein
MFLRFYTDTIYGNAEEALGHLEHKGQRAPAR